MLFVFAHQDDEIGACPSILRELRAGGRVWCAYLTDGALRSQARVRDSESVRFLTWLGVARERIAFIADEAGRVADGALVDSLVRSEAALRAWLMARGLVPQMVYSLDWEGGHVDHDAAHLVALSTAAAYGVQLFVFSLYNAYRRPRKLFRVIDFVPHAGSPETAMRLSWRDAFVTALAPLAFPSQRRTWAALGLGLTLRILLQRKERVRPAALGRITAAPHAGAPLYETLFGHSSAEFMAASRAYRERLLNAGAGSHVRERSLRDDIGFAQERD